MPIITGTVVDTPPVGSPVVLPEVGHAVVTYYDPHGEAWPLTDPPRGWFTLADGVQGLGAAPLSVANDPHPRGGSRRRHVQPQARTINWPLHVYGSTHEEFLARWRALGKALTDTNRFGPGILEIARPSGSRRQISVFYDEGWEGQPQQGFGRIGDSAPVVLWCEDPYWFDPVPVADHREYGGGVPFLNPFLTISSGQVLGATTLINPGDVTAWPTWTITGPASLVAFTNTTTGESFELNPNASGIAHGNLTAGQQVTVRTDPIQVRYQDGSVWTGALNYPDAQLWGLAPGSNDVTFALSGSGPGSAVDVEFMARYETA